MSAALAAPADDPVLTEALALANDLGWHVFPCNTEKRPCTPNGFRDASADPEVIRKLWRDRPGPLIGVATGAASNVDVLDVDLYKPAAAAWLEENKARMPDTFSAITQRGGRHFYFPHHPSLRCSQDKLAHGVDIRADGGYAIYWPAAGYGTWGRAILPWPEFLAEQLGAAETGPRDAPAAETADDLRAVDPDALAAIIENLPNDAAFDDRSVWVSLAHAIAASFADDPARAEELWLRHAAKRQQKDGEPERVWKTLQGPHDAGPGTILKLARAAGIDCSRYDAAVAAAAFAAAPPLPPEPEPAAPELTPDAPADPPGKASMRDIVIDALLAAGLTLWRDADGDALCTVPVGTALHRYRVRSKSFLGIARQIFGKKNTIKTGTGSRPATIPAATMDEVLLALEAMAFDGAIREPAVRVSADAGGAAVDLGCEDWRIVRVSGEGWRIEDRADVPLIRPSGARALPFPMRDPSALSRLRAMLNLPGTAHDNNFMLVAAWLVAALFPSGPFCVLAIDGEQGSAKSTVCRMLRRLVDPNKAELRATPRTEDDLIIAAANGRIIALDNVSFIEADMADAICRVATGAGFAKRTLYSDTDETIIQVCRPVLLNGIPSLLARGDLADRSIAITLPPIPDSARVPEARIWAEFEAAAPGILAALLDGLATAFRRLPGLQLPMLPRMADFARIACAAAPAFEWTEAEMIAAIHANRDGTVSAVIDADPLAGAIVELADTPGGWRGTATELLEKLKLTVPVELLRERGWPKDATRLSSRLTRVAPALRRSGVDVVTTREGKSGQRVICIRRLP